MASSFNETVTQMGYKIVYTDNEEIMIQKRSNSISTCILFNKNLKQIIGGIKNHNFICNLNDISTQYNFFQDLEKDLKTFKQLSGYDIMN